MEELVELIDELVKEIPYVEKMLQIEGVGIKTISGLTDTEISWICVGRG